MLIQMCHDDEVTLLLIYSTWTQFVGSGVETEEYVEVGSERPIANFTEIIPYLLRSAQRLPSNCFFPFSFILSFWNPEVLFFTSCSAHTVLLCTS